jgi:phage tail-like protein
VSAIGKLDRYLPAVFQERAREEDPLRAVLGAFEQELDRVDDALVRFETQLAPSTATYGRERDFLTWLAGWVAVDPALVTPYPLGDEATQERRRERLLRALVARATELHAAAGTAAGLADWLLATTEARVELCEWCWPTSFVVGVSSMVGVDGWLGDQTLPTHRCAVVIELGEDAALSGVPTQLSGRGQEDRLLTPIRARAEASPDPGLDFWLRAVRRALDTALPAGVEAWLLVRLGGTSMRLERRWKALIIGITSEVGAAVIEAEA